MYSQNDWRLYGAKELYHHGIKGQKWGIRRYQNADGSLTSEGQKHYGYNGSNSKPSKEEKRRLREEKRREKEEAEYRIKNHENYTDAKKQVSMFLALAALDVISLNPINMTYDIKKAIDAGSAYIKTKKFDKERELGKIDPKTGFRLKHSELSEKEDLARVNPSFGNFDSNTKSNCMLCTTTYDMRRRGYDVTAKTAGAGFVTDSIKAWYPNAKIERIVGENTTKSNWNSLNKITKDATEKFKRAALSQGEGARGNVMVTWFPFYGGHSMVYEVKDGKVRILDGQSNKIYNDPYKIFKQTNGIIEFARLDNVDFDPEAIKRCCR